jgi:hypothetical protein
VVDTKLILGVNMRFDSFIAIYVQVISWSILAGSTAAFVGSWMRTEVSVLLGGIVWAVGLILFAVLMVLERIFATLRDREAGQHESSFSSDD